MTLPQLLNITQIQNCSFWKKTYDPLPVTEVYWSYMFSSSACCALSVPTIILNLLVVMAIYRTKTLHRPYNYLLCSLAVSDFIIGFLAEPLYVIHLILEIKGDVTWYCVTGAATAFVSYTTAGASLFTLAAMSVDRWLAIDYSLEYRSVVTSYRVGMVTALLWSLAAIGSSLRLVLSVKYFFFSLSFVMLIALSIIFVANIRAFRSLKIQRRRVLRRMKLHQGQEEVKLARSRKFLITMLYVLGLVLLCYVPFGTVTVLTAMDSVTSETRAAWNIADPIGYMNSSLNPIVYCLRLPGIANAVRDVIQQLCCSSSARVTRVNPLNEIKFADLGNNHSASRKLTTIPEETIPPEDKNETVSNGVITTF